MWTTENRTRYNRDKLRYPSDATEEEWGQLAALILPARRGGSKRTVNIREVLNGLLPDVSGGRFRQTCRPVVRSLIIWGAGKRTARWGRFIRHCM